jgi:outer membrane protein OmpA-like peptidoglycan-associated protein
LLAAAALAPFAGVAAAADPRPERLGETVNVYFAKTSSKLTGEAAGLVDAAAEYAWNPSNLVTRIEITGHTDTAESHPEKLSLARAQAVRKRLLESGLPASVSVTVKAVGAADLQAPTPPKTWEPLNRVVVIDLT